MYQFASDEQRDAYRAALAAGKKQGIGASIYKSPIGTISGYTIVDTPSIDVRCTEDDEIFNVAEMYVGELKLRIQTDNDFGIRASKLIGGTIELNFVQHTEEYELDGTTYSYVSIPLGVWDIIDAKRESQNFISILANDRIAKLSVPMDTDPKFVGMITLAKVMEHVESSAGIEFAQTPAEVYDLFIENPGEEPYYNFCTHYEETCWDEVRLIAQAMGGFAFANREGMIEFRTFNNLSSTPVLSIPADKRFRAKLQEGLFAVKSISYTDENGNSYSSSDATGMDTSSIICLDNIKYIHKNYDYTDYYVAVANNFLDQVSHIRVIPGTVDFYGDPSLDLGDMVLLTNYNGQGIGGADVKFLVTSIYWQLRGPQTIICAGAPSLGEYVTSSSSEGSHSTPVPGGSSKAATANIVSVDLTPYTGALFPTARTVARTRFSNTSKAEVFIECELTILGTDSSTIQAAVYLDDVLQPITPKTSIEQGRYTTLTFLASVSLSSGVHTVRITALGLSELTDVQGRVWGQNINATSLLYSNQYTYTIVDDEAIITEYTGSDTQVEIPEKLGECNTTTIARYSFKDKLVTTVYIPEGVTKIE